MDNFPLPVCRVDPGRSNAITHPQNQQKTCGCFLTHPDMICLAVCQNLVPLVNIKIAGKWMFIPLKMVLIGIDPYPFLIGLPIFRHKRTLHRLQSAHVSGALSGWLSADLESWRIYQQGEEMGYTIWWSVTVYGKTAFFKGKTSF